MVFMGRDKGVRLQVQVMEIPLYSITEGAGKDYVKNSVGHVSPETLYLLHDSVPLS